MITGSKGIGSVAATGVMFIFSILFFGILTDAGTFRPIIKGILNLVGTDPVKIGIGTAILAAIVHLDGSGAVTFLICVPALLPLYDALGMRRTTLATIVALSAGTMNILPWGGPTIRAATALGMGDNPVAFFLPVLPAYVLATVINYPSVKDSKARVDAHAKEALMMCSVLFAAGCFTGIMQGTGMITEMASTLVSIIPHTMGKFFPLIIGIIGMPASLLFDPDSFYYGVLPVLAQTAEGFGVAGVDVGRAAILGQMTIGFPVSPLTASTFLLVGLSGVDFGEHQKKTIPLAWLVSLVMVVVAILTRGIAI